MRNRLTALKESPKPEWPCLPRLIAGALTAATVALLLGRVFA